MTAAATRSCRAIILGKDTSGAASVTPRTRPVSCTGKNPFGTLMARTTVRATVAMVTASVRPWCRRTQSSVRL